MNTTVKTKADHISGPLKTSDYSYEEHYQLFDNLHIGISQGDIDRILENVCAHIEWGTKDRFMKKIKGKEELKSYFENLLSDTRQYIAKIKLTTWDPLLNQGFVWIEYERIETNGNKTHVHEFGIFQVTDGLISDFLSMEKIAWQVQVGS